MAGLSVCDGHGLVLEVTGRNLKAVNAGLAPHIDNTLPVVPEHVYRAEIKYTGDRFSIAPNLEWLPDGPLQPVVGGIDRAGHGFSLVAIPRQPSAKSAAVDFFSRAGHGQISFTFGK